MIGPPARRHRIALVVLAALLATGACARRAAAPVVQSLAVAWAFQPGDDPG